MELVNTISQHVTAMSEEGIETAHNFHKRLQRDGIKPSVSADLWSKNGCALLGTLSHGIEAEDAPPKCANEGIHEGCRRIPDQVLRIPDQVLQTPVVPSRLHCLPVAAYSMFKILKAKTSALVPPCPPRLVLLLSGR